MHESVPPRSHSTTDSSHLSVCSICHRTCAKPCTVVGYVFKGILYSYTVLVAELVRSLGKWGLSCCIHNSPFVCCACMHVTTERCRMCNAAWNNLMTDVIRLVMVSSP